MSVQPSEHVSQEGGNLEETHGDGLPRSPWSFSLSLPLMSVRVQMSLLNF